MTYLKPGQTHAGSDARTLPPDQDKVPRCEVCGRRIYTYSFGTLCLECERWAKKEGVYVRD